MWLPFPVAFGRRAPVGRLVLGGVLGGHVALQRLGGWSLVGKFFGRGVFNCSARLCFAKRVGGALGVGMGVGTTVSRPNFWSFFCDFLKGNTPPKKNSALRGCEAAPRRLRRRGAAPLVIAPKNRDFDFWRSRVAPNDSAR